MVENQLRQGFGSEGRAALGVLITLRAGRPSGVPASSRQLDPHLWGQGETGPYVGGKLDFPKHRVDEWDGLGRQQMS